MCTHPMFSMSDNMTIIRILIMNILLFQNNYPWLSNLVIITYLTNNEKDIIVNVSNVVLSNASWEFHEINLLIKDSIIHKLYLQK